MCTSKRQHRLVAPDGGWGNVVAVSLSIALTVTINQLVAFGIVYGKFLRQITDEASASAAISGIFNTMLNLMGLVTNQMMEKYSFRFVGIIGSILFFVGNVLSIFANSLWQLVISFGVIQAMGLGIILPAVYASFNEYFTEKKNFMMGVAQTIVAAFAMGVPYFSQILMNMYGYRGTVAILAAISLHSLIGVLTLQPVKWHMVKVPIQPSEICFLEIENINTIEGRTINTHNILHVVDKHKLKSKLKMLLRTLSNFLMVSLLKDSVYFNTAMGLALSFISDIMFISLLPMFINHLGYNADQTAYIMTIYTTADLVGRILFSAVSAVTQFRSRLLFLIGSGVIAIFRIAFTLLSGEWHATIILIVILGLLRCLILVQVPLVLVEYSETKFPAAYSLFQAITGIVSIASGQLSSLVAVHTASDAWVQHLLTLQLLLCVFPWLIEMYVRRNKTNF